jgi:myo-inositol-1(or 4)-monophosphatase
MAGDAGYNAAGTGCRRRIRDASGEVDVYEQELEVAIAATRRAGAAIEAVRARGTWNASEKEGGAGPVTEADLAANAILIEAIQGAFPEDGILSEETTDDPARLSRRRVWIIDPLDGTREFTLGLPEYCVSVGLSVDGEAVLGVLLNPATGELAAGVVGQGATFDGAPCAATTHAGLSGARFVVSRTEHGKGGFEAWADQVALVPTGSVAWKIALVAAGRAEASFTPKPRSEWDLAGGVAVLVAAGGRATDRHGRPYRFNQPKPLVDGVVCTNGALHDAVLGLLGAAR